MHWFRRMIWRFDVLFRKQALEDELNKELHNHLDAEVRSNIQDGMSPEAARRKAMVDFGGVERVKEEVRDARGARPLDDFIQDTRHAVRGLAKRPLFAGAAILTLALGIGASTAMFSVLRNVLLSPLPYENPEELVMIWGELRARDVLNWTSSPPEYGDYLELESYQEVATIRPMSLTLTGGDQAEQIHTATVSHNFFEVFSTPFLHGRPFVEEDIEALLQPLAPGQEPPVMHAILGHGLWQRRWGGDPDIVGRSVDISGRAMTVVGILPEDFSLLLPTSAGIGAELDLFVTTPIPITRVPRRNVGYRIVARLKSDVTPAQAQAEMDAHWARMREEYQLYVDTDYYGHVVPLLDDLVADVRPLIIALFGAVLFVLLISCANVASLLLVRARARAGEMSIRAALGGSRSRLARQMLSEGLVLGGVAAALGVGFAKAALSVLSATRPVELPRMEAIALDAAVLAFSLLVTLSAVFLFGLVPAIRGSRTDLSQSLQIRGTGSEPGVRGRLRNGLVVAEVALSLVLLIGAGLMVRSSFSLARVDPGYDSRNLLTFQAAVPPGAYRTPEARMGFASQLQERLSGLPGVVSVSASGGTPFGFRGNIGRAGPEEALEDESLNEQARYTWVLPDYFRTMGTTLLEGRLFTPAEFADSVPVVLVDNLLAQAIWPGETAVGKILVTRPGSGDPTPHEVVGVVEHQRVESLTDSGEDFLYHPFRYYGARLGLTWMVRTAVPPESLVPLVRREVEALNPDTPLTKVRTMDSYLAQAQAPTRFALSLIGFFAGTALILAVIGLYGVLAYGVQQRTSEIGVRMAFGAEPREILSLILGKGLRLAVVGIALGVAGAVGLTRFMSSLLVGVEPVDPPTFLGIGALFALVAALACYFPARRASGVDPVRAIQVE